MPGTKHRLRKEYEHKLLPQLFYTDKDRFIYVCTNSKTILYEMIDDIFVNHPLKNPYTPEQFSAQLGRLDENLLLLKLTFPEPEIEGECYCSYLFFDPEFTKPRYYCMEKEKKGDDPVICAWTPELKHIRHKKCKTSDELRECMLLYLRDENK